MAPVAASAIVEGAVQQSALDADRAGVDVHVDLAPDLPLVVGEAGALQSAVQNLIGNAIKYAGEDRWVRVHVEAPSGARGRARLCERSGLRGARGMTRRSCQAASSSAWQLRGRLRGSLRSFWPMSRRAILIPRAAKRSCSFCRH